MSDSWLTEVVGTSMEKLKEIETEFKKPAEEFDADKFVSMIFDFLFDSGPSFRAAQALLKLSGIRVLIHESDSHGVMVASVFLPNGEERVVD